MSTQTALNALLAGDPVSERSLGSRLLNSMSPLIAAEILIRTGRRGHLRAANTNALQRWYEITYPHGLNPEKPSSRASAVLLHSDSKRHKTSGSPAVLMRSIGNGRLIQHDGSEIYIRSRTDGIGAIGLDLAHNVPKAMSPIALIENSEPFYDDDLLNRLDLRDHIIIYTHGNPSKSLLNWISTSGAPEIVHLPDYDSTGLSCFLRLYDATNGQATLYVPDHFERIATEHGNPRLALNLSKTTDRSLASSSHPVVREISRILLKAGVGLEQEILSLL